MPLAGDERSNVFRIQSPVIAQYARQFGAGNAPAGTLFVARNLWQPQVFDRVAKWAVADVV